jgi:hypothetical protein
VAAVRQSTACGALALATMACGGRSALDDEVTFGQADASSTPTTASDAQTSLDAPAPASDAPADSAPDVPPPPWDVDGGLVAECATGGNVLFVDGDPGEIEHSGALRFGPSSGSWSAPSPGPENIIVDFFATDTMWGDGWITMLSTQQSGATLGVGRYDNVQIVGGESPGHTGMYVEGGFHACGTISGWFQIEQLETQQLPGPQDLSILRALTVTFEQSCNGETAVLHGCLHFEQP